MDVISDVTNPNDRPDPELPERGLVGCTLGIRTLCRIRTALQAGGTFCRVRGTVSDLVEELCVLQLLQGVFAFDKVLRENTQVALFAFDQSCQIVP